MLGGGGGKIWRQKKSLLNIFYLTWREVPVPWATGEIFSDIIFYYNLQFRNIFLRPANAETRNEGPQK